MLLRIKRTCNSTKNIPLSESVNHFQSQCYYHNFVLGLMNGIKRVVGHNSNQNISSPLWSSSPARSNELNALGNNKTTTVSTPMKRKSDGWKPVNK